jgi:hypothetical protein
MFFEADVRDTPECAPKVVNGNVGFGETITNPAMSCPDAFAWKLFSEITVSGWWENWSTDRQTFPSDPWPRCAPGETVNCCRSLEISNEVWPEHCPVFPGGAEGEPRHVVGEPSKAHQVPLSSAAITDANGDGAKNWEDVPAVLKTAVIGAEQNELIYRNRPMVEYILDRALYSTDGLAAVYDNFVRALAAYAPRQLRPLDPTAKTASTPPTVQINFPVKSIMVKANWMAVDKAKDYGIDPYNKDRPFIVMNLVPQVDTNTAPKDRPVETKPFVLLSMHISTKDLPNWFWSTFEHVDNIGRCDWIGCNDSFGYRNMEPLPVDAPRSGGLAEPSRNYTPPHAVATVDGANVQAFKLAERYSSADAITEGLSAMFEAFGIATATEANTSGRPAAADAAWKSYRLKGTQTNFVTSTGRPTRLGNSVTEAGFTNSASCITCHARAGATKTGRPPLSIFVDDLSYAGVPKSVNGVPNEAWFNVNGYWNADGQREAPIIHAVPTDFVWGFRMACPMTKRMWAHRGAPTSRRPTVNALQQLALKGGWRSGS